MLQKSFTSTNSSFGRRGDRSKEIVLLGIDGELIQAKRIFARSPWRPKKAHGWADEVPRSKNFCLYSIKNLVATATDQELALW